MRARAAVHEAVQEANAAAGVSDGLREPDDGLGARVRRLGRRRGVLGGAVGVPGGRERDDDQERVDGPWDQGEQGGGGQRVDVVELEAGGEAEPLAEGVHY